MLVEQDSGVARTSPDIAPDTAELAFFPARPGSDRWIAFGQTREGVRAEYFPSGRLTSSASAAPVLESFSRELALASRVRILAYGETDRVDWHVVPWKGQPLIASRAVEYAMDVGARRTASGAPSGSKGVLLVTNPTGDLGATRVEGDVVAKSLLSPPARSFRRLDGPAATRDALLAALTDTEFLHYAGHAEVTGPSGISSALLMANGARLELGDLLAAPHVPAAVVLSACEAAGSVGGSMMGLAQAFVASGTQVVVAPTRPIRDSSAFAFMTAMYAGLTAVDPASMAAAYRRAVLSNLHNADAQTFRLVVQ